MVAVGEEGVGGQVRRPALDFVGDDTARARDRLAAALEHQREADREPRVIRPEWRGAPFQLRGRRPLSPRSSRSGCIGESERRPRAYAPRNEIATIHHCSLVQQLASP